jgi:F-type H+-transporting ATPase subunit epsilon
VAIDATSLALNVATPNGMMLSLEVESVQLPASNGEIGILPGHIPILAALKPGVIKYKVKGGASGVAAIGSGFAEGDAKHVRVIAEYFARPEDIERAEAQSDLERATQNLKNLNAVLGEPAQIEAQRDLDWALARLEIAGGSSTH